MEKIKIGFTISNSWGVKNLLNSGVIPELKSSFYISIYTTKDLCGHIESQFPSAFDRLHLIIDEETSINKLIRKLKKFIFISINNLKTVKITTKRKTSFIFYMLFIAFFNIFRLFCSHSLLMMIDKIHSHFLKRQTHSFVPDSELIFFFEPFDYREITLQHFCKQLNIQVASAIPSWDNPSTKGFLFPHSDYYLVWGDHQKNEIQNLYPNISDSKVVAIGAPQFDHYIKNDYYNKKSNTDRIKEKYNIAKTSRIILFAAGAPVNTKMEPKVAEFINNYINKSKIDLHLIIRLHPYDLSSRFDELEGNKKVTIFRSSMDKSDNLFSWKPPLSEINDLTEMLEVASLVVNTASTMNLEALFFDIPIINLGIDNVKPRICKDSQFHYYLYDHLEDMFLNEFMPVAYTFQELESFIKISLDNPQGFSKERHKLVKKYILHSTNSYSVRLKELINASK